MPMELLDVLQQRFIRQTSAEASAAGRKAAAAKRAVSDMEEQLDRVSLVCASLWELMRERLEISDDELLAKMREIDLRDGVADGKLRLAPATCAACARISHPRHRQCVYCGGELSRVLV